MEQSDKPINSGVLRSIMEGRAPILDDGAWIELYARLDGKWAEPESKGGH